MTEDRPGSGGRPGGGVAVRVLTIAFALLASGSLFLPWFAVKSVTDAEPWTAINHWRWGDSEIVGAITDWYPTVDASYAPLIIAMVGLCAVLGVIQATWCMRRRWVMLSAWIVGLVFLLIAAECAAWVLSFEGASISHGAFVGLVSLVGLAFFLGFSSMRSSEPY